MKFVKLVDCGPELIEVLKVRVRIRIRLGLIDVKSESGGGKPVMAHGGKI